MQLDDASEGATTILYVKNGIAKDAIEQYIKAGQRVKTCQVRGRCSLVYVLEDVRDNQGQKLCIKRVVEEDQYAPHSVMREIKAYSMIKDRQFVADLQLAFTTQEDSFTTIVDLVMPWYGMTLKDLFHASPGMDPTNGVSPANYFQLVEDTFSALDYLHQTDIAHRDIKPENVVIVGSGARIKLIDFGTCWLPSDPAGDDGRGKKHSQIGTGAYRPIECLFSPTNGYDAKKVDIWQSAVMLCEPFVPRKDGNVTTLFEGDRGDLGLANSIFDLLGLPQVDEQDSWPESQFFQPSLERMPFARRPPKEGGLRVMLMDTSPSDTEMQAVITILSNCIQLSASKRPTASEVCRQLSL